MKKRERERERERDSLNVIYFIESTLHDVFVYKAGAFTSLVNITDMVDDELK